MDNAYLYLAERILAQARRPMTPAEIIERAYLDNVVPDHLHGNTQHKTLQARLSEDVSRHVEGSKFFRTAPGRFFLKALKNDPSVPDIHKTEWHAPPRRKELKRDRVLAVCWPEPPNLRADLQLVPFDKIYQSLERGRYVYEHWRSLASSETYVPIHSFVVVHRDDEILSYRSGKFVPHSDPLRGMRSIGFGGAVFASDVDLLYNSIFGIAENAIDDLAYGIGLPKRMAEDARYKNQVHPYVGALLFSPKTQMHHLYVALCYKCPKDFIPAKSALSLNELRWVHAKNPGNHLGDYDLMSRFLFGFGLPI